MAGQRVLDHTEFLHALRVRGFRWFVLGRVVGGPTGPMRAVVQGWLIYHLTGSAVVLGWITAIRALALLTVAPFAGVIADRFDKRLVMLGCRAALVIVTAGITLLLYLGRLEPWHLAVAAVFEGILFTILDVPLNTVVSEMVDRKTLLSALSVVSLVEGLFSVIGAAGAGLLIVWVGPVGVYGSMALLFFAAGVTHTQLPALPGASDGPASLRGDFGAGVRYLWLNPMLIALLVLGLARQALAQPYNTLLPVFAQRDLLLDAAGLGLLTSAAAAGNLVTALIVTLGGDMRAKGRWLLLSGCALAVSVLLLLAVRTLPAPFLFVALAGGSIASCDVLTRTLLQSACDLRYRARVFSVGMTLHGMMNLIALPAAALADRFSVAAVLGVLAVFVILAHIVAAALRPDIRQLA